MYAVLGSNPLIGKKIFSAGQSPRGAAEGGDSPAELRGGVRGILEHGEAAGKPFNEATMIFPKGFSIKVMIAICKCQSLLRR